jgi:hypothetical protein
MIIDPLSIAGILSVALYLLAFVWFGRETLRVEEDEPGFRGVAVDAACQEC